MNKAFKTEKKNVCKGVVESKKKREDKRKKREDEREERKGASLKRGKTGIYR